MYIYIYMIDFEYSIDQKPELILLSTPLSTPVYARLRQKCQSLRGGGIGWAVGAKYGPLATNHTSRDFCLRFVYVLSTDKTAADFQNSRSSLPPSSFLPPPSFLSPPSPSLLFTP